MISMKREIVVYFQDLIEEHAEIDRLSRQLESLVGATRPDVAAAERLLSALAKAVAAHLRKEESFIYPGLVDHDGSSRTNALVADFEVLKMDWSTYVDTWQRQGALSDWAGFGTETPAKLKDLREKARDEVDMLYVAALREGLVRLRPALVKS